MFFENNSEMKRHPHSQTTYHQLEKCQAWLGTSKGESGENNHQCPE